VLSYRLRPELKDLRRAHGFVLGRLVDAFRQRGLAVAHAGTSDLVVEQGAGSGEQGAGKQVAESMEHGVLSTEYGGTSPLPASTPGLPLRAPNSPLPAPRSLLKFSGNSLRAKRTHLVYHGTLLYEFDLALIESCLRMPARMPDYRAVRAHRDFVTNLPIARQSLVSAVDAAWPTESSVFDWPAARVAQLAAERFKRDDWAFEFP
jgi:lipoate-protein ligase A